MHARFAISVPTGRDTLPQPSEPLPPSRSLARGSLVASEKGVTAMKISSLMQTDLATCRAADTLEHAAALMWERDVGCLPVIDESNHLVAMVTDRDICMAAYRRGLPLRALPVAVAMSARVVACTADEEVEDVEARMATHRVRRMPVIDAHDHPIALVSLEDLARATSAGEVSPTSVTRTLAAVSQPRPLIV